jgi:hypothetical protein
MALERGIRCMTIRTTWKPTIGRCNLDVKLDKLAASYS